MPYERGKRSVALGQLQVWHLNNGVVTVGTTFQLPGPMPPAHVAPLRQGQARRVFTRRQVQAMATIVQERDEIELAFDATNPWGAPDRISGPEFVFHGTGVTWDAIYEAGSLRSVGMNTSISLHVASSNLNASAYVSGTRSLSVAQSFASGGGISAARGEYGFVYLFHVEGGIVISNIHGHSQAEIAGIGEVPIRDILMFKWLAQPRKVYVNLDYRATPLTLPTINMGLLMIGGGATP